MPTQQLTAHFTLDEMIQSQTAACTGISNMPDADELIEVKATADWRKSASASAARQRHKHPAYFTSGARCASSHLRTVARSATPGSAVVLPSAVTRSVRGSSPLHAGSISYWRRS